MGKSVFLDETNVGVITETRAIDTEKMEEKTLSYHVTFE